MLSEIGAAKDNNCVLASVIDLNDRVTASAGAPSLNDSSRWIVTRAMFLDAGHLHRLPQCVKLEHQPSQQQWIG